MPGLLSKYFGQDPDLYVGSVVGRIDRYPVIGGSVPFLTQQEADDAPLVSQFRSRWFCLWKPADLELFVRIMDHVYNGEFLVKHRRDVPVPEVTEDGPGGSLKVWLEWVQIEARPAMQSSGFGTDNGPAMAGNFTFGGG
jgi:hypothetical protein